MLWRTFLKSLWQNGKEKSDMLEVKFYDTVDETKILQNGNYMAELQKDVKNNVILYMIFTIKAVSGRNVLKPLLCS